MVQVGVSPASVLIVISLWDCVAHLTHLHRGVALSAAFDARNGLRATCTLAAHVTWRDLWGAGSDSGSDCERFDLPTGRQHGGRKCSPRSPCIAFQSVDSEERKERKKWERENKIKRRKEKETIFSCLNVLALLLNIWPKIVLLLSSSSPPPTTTTATNLWPCDRFQRCACEPDYRGQCLESKVKLCCLPTIRFSGKLSVKLSGPGTVGPTVTRFVTTP